MTFPESSMANYLKGKKKNNLISIITLCRHKGKILKKKKKLEKKRYKPRMRFSQMLPY